MNPEPSRVIKYPKEIRRKKEPASAWLIARSDSTPGIKGARIMRDKKFTKKMEVSNRSGRKRALNVS
jgi:hypothetical protein